MKILDNKRLMFIALGALIITLIINFPNLIDVFKSDAGRFGHFEKINSARPPFHGTGVPMHGKYMSEDKPIWTKEAFQVFQFLWYYLLGFVLLVNTTKQNEKEEKHPLLITSLKVLASITFLFLVESLIIRQLTQFRMIGFRHGIDAVLLGRYMFAALISSLSGILYTMFDKKNKIEIENEQLRSENLQIRYNVLANQMNPHFLFNSLNSLQYLLIEQEYGKSRVYVEELSTVFRYILQSSKKELVKVKEELDFLSSYEFLLKIRFEDKIKFEIDIPEEALDSYIPVLSLQPLVENAINHNSCGIDKPLIIKIYSDKYHIAVENNILPKIRPEKSTGIGNENLRKRFMLLLNKEINIINSGNTYKVILPLK